MRVLVIGGTGMLGHKVVQVLSDRFETYLTGRSPFDSYADLGITSRERWLGGVDVTRLDDVLRAVERVEPDAIVNCAGIIKQTPAAEDALLSIRVNALFPHQLARVARLAGAYLVHISTDCVFSGARGRYTEQDVPDPPDLYGRSKLLGEVAEPGCLTLRTSMIGRELRTRYGLVEWFLGQEGGTVEGYDRAIFTGLPTVVLASVIAELLNRKERIEGLYHVASEPISKYELLCLLRAAYALNVGIERNTQFVCDRSLLGNRFRAATGLEPRPWPEMIETMVADSTRHLAVGAGS